MPVISRRLDPRPHRVRARVWALATLGLLACPSGNIQIFDGLPLSSVAEYAALLWWMPCLFSRAVASRLGTLVARIPVRAATASIAVAFTAKMLLAGFGLDDGLPDDVTGLQGRVCLGQFAEPHEGTAVPRRGGASRHGPCGTLPRDTPRGDGCGPGRRVSHAPRQAPQEELAGRPTDHHPRTPSALAPPARHRRDPTRRARVDRRRRRPRAGHGESSTGARTRHTEFRGGA